MSRTDGSTAGTETRSTQTHAHSQAQGRAQLNHLSDCRCGQELDMSARAHCPRCGRSINQP